MGLRLIADPTLGAGGAAGQHAGAMRSLTPALAEFAALSEEPGPGRAGSASQE